MAEQRVGSTLAPLQVLFEAGSVVGRTDGELLDQFATGQAEQAGSAFAALVARHGPLVLRVARRILDDPTDADDVFQATFLILARRVGSIRQRGSLAAWLHGVAAHVAASSRAAAHRRRLHEARAGSTRPTVTPGTSADDRGAIVHEELGRLPEPYRTAVVLCCLQGLTQQEAAQQVGWPLGTLQSRLARGRTRLRVGLTRRGLAPALTASALTFPSAGVEAAVPVGLAHATVQLAVTGGTVPLAIEVLVTQGVRAMFLTQGKIATLVVSLAVGLIGTGVGVWAFGQGPPEPIATAQPSLPAPIAGETPDDGLLTVTGTVVLPDGSPAAGATVTSLTEQSRSNSVQTDRAGRFTLRGVFENSGRLHAEFPGGQLQAVRVVAEGDVRTAFARPIELKLAAAVSHRVLVRAEGQPVAGATVVGEGTNCIVRSQTGPDGGAVLAWLPGEAPDEIIAWHPDRGINARSLPRAKIDPAPATSIEIDLLPSQPRTVRAVDGAGRGVAGLDLAVAFLPDDAARTRAWVSAKAIPAAHVRTNASGVALVPWAPRTPLQYVDVDLVASDWKIDSIDPAQPSEAVTTVHVRPEHAVPGRLVLPNGASAAGIGITGFGFGPQNRGSIPYARARSDGTFTIRVPADHGFALGVIDSEWASDPWTGPILAKDDATPAEITIPVYPATPLTVRVTRGPAHEPVGGAFVHLGPKVHFSWLDATGERRSGTGGPEFWARTDAQGLVHAGVGRGEQHIRLSTPTWNEEQTVPVTNQPQTVEFHRPWIGTRRIAGRITLGSERYPATPTLNLRAWVIEPNHLPERIDLPLRPDGTFEIVRDAATIEVLAHDLARHLAAALTIPSDALTVDLALQPTATYSGTLVDEDDQPMADQALAILSKTANSDPLITARTDEQGRFTFPSVPAGMPLEIYPKYDQQADWSQLIFANALLFQPGEVRHDAKLKAQWAYGGDHSTPPPRPVAARAKTPSLAASVKTTTANAEVAGMHALALIQGDDSDPIARVTTALLDFEKTPSVLNYLPIAVAPVRARAEAATLAQLGWPNPEPGALVLLVLDAAGKPIATERVPCADPAGAIRQADQFLQAHRPPARDARASVGSARHAAKATARRVWLILGSPRCGPCFTLARWVEEHHAILERDYVVVKVMEGLDEHADEVVADLPTRAGDGVPWFAITEPDGTILTTSVGPLGNVGCPTSVEDLRHFRTMLDATRRQLTAADVDALIQSRASSR